MASQLAHETVSKGAATLCPASKANSPPVAGQVVVAVSPIIVLPPAIMDGYFKVRLAGVPGRTYAIEGAAGVQGPWTKIINVTAPGTDAGLGVGVFEFSEAVRGTPARFYRAYHLAS